MKRQICRTCGRRRLIKFFYKNDRNLSGYNYKCKDCIREAARRRRNGSCELCGAPMYKDTKKRKYCKDCREVAGLMTIINPREHDSCSGCAFLRECNDNIWRKSFTPYCFVTSKYHEFYVSEYQGAGV